MMAFEEAIEQFEADFGALTLGDHGTDFNALGNSIIEAIADEEFRDEDVDDLMDRFKFNVNAWFEMLEEWKKFVGS